MPESDKPIQVDPLPVPPPGTGSIIPSGHWIQIVRSLRNIRDYFNEDGGMRVEKGGLTVGAGCVSLKEGVTVEGGVSVKGEDGLEVTNGLTVGTIKCSQLSATSSTGMEVGVPVAVEYNNCLSVVVHESDAPCVLFAVGSAVVPMSRVIVGAVVVLRILLGTPRIQDEKEVVDYAARKPAIEVRVAGRDGAVGDAQLVVHGVFKVPAGKHYVALCRQSPSFAVPEWPQLSVVGLPGA